MVEVMFWNEAGEALKIGDESKFYFENDRDATEFIESVNIPDAVEVSIDGILYKIFEDVDDGYSQNTPYFWNCQN